MSCILFNYRNKLQVSIHYSWFNSPILAILRIISLALIVIRYVAYMDGNSDIASYQFIYLTFYGFIVTLIHYTSVVIHLIISKLLLRNNKQSKINKFIQDSINVMYEVSLAIELTLTLLFWTLLAQGPNLGGFDNLGIHLMPFVLLSIDFIFNSYQFPIRHFIFTTIVAGIYIIINQVHSCSSEPVYNVYQCGGILIPIVAFVILALTHMIGHLVWKYWRGKKIKEQLKRSQSGNLLQNSSLLEDN